MEKVGESSVCVFVWFSFVFLHCLLPSANLRISHDFALCSSVFQHLSSDSRHSAGPLQGSEVVPGAGRQCVSSWFHRCLREISHCLSMQA